jgi:hypothetical protein
MSRRDQGPESRERSTSSLVAPTAKARIATRAITILVQVQRRAGSLAIGSFVILALPVIGS